MAKVITIGETMAAFTPNSGGPLRYVSGYGIRTAGAESNVAVGLSKLGIESAWFSRLGNDEFGMFIRNSLRSEGVDCSRVIFDPDHSTGVMFKQTGAGETSVFYYRENSAASHLCEDDITKELLSGAEIVHLSGITPVLSESCLGATLKALMLAKEMGIKVSFDPNIRKKLWKNADYSPMLRAIALNSDIVLIGRDEAETIFDTKDLDEVYDFLFNEGKAKYIAIKDGANGAYVSDSKMRIKIPPYPCKPVDPIGAGDGFNAGFLAGIIKGCDVVEAGKIGAICGALATECIGDVEGYPDEERLNRIMNGSSTIFR